MSEAGAYQIQRLGPADLPAMRALNVMFGEAFETPAHYGGSPPADAYLERLLDKPTFYAFAAFSAEEEVIGGLCAYEFEKFEREHSEVYLYDIAVAESHRRRGIARALIMALGHAAEAQGASLIIVQAEFGDEGPIALYDSLGKQSQIASFEIDLPIPSQ